MARRGAGSFPPTVRTHANRRSCLFAPPEPNSVIGNTEQEEVAWCIRKCFAMSAKSSTRLVHQRRKRLGPGPRLIRVLAEPRNNARVIPDGTFQAVHFVKTPLYWQVMGWGDFTKINIAAGDFGGELDPHGATGDGNPVGGNVTANATGQDVHYQEWMK